MVPAWFFLFVLIIFALEGLLIWADRIIVAHRERDYWAHLERQVRAEVIDWEREGWL